MHPSCLASCVLRRRPCLANCNLGASERRPGARSMQTEPCKARGTLLERRQRAWPIRRDRASARSAPPDPSCMQQQRAPWMHARSFMVLCHGSIQHATAVAEQQLRAPLQFRGGLDRARRRPRNRRDPSSAAAALSSSRGCSCSIHDGGAVGVADRPGSIQLVIRLPVCAHTRVVAISPGAEAPPPPAVGRCS